jgi:hypothetical protein
METNNELTQLEKELRQNATLKVIFLRIGGHEFYEAAALKGKLPIVYAYGDTVVEAVAELETALLALGETNEPPLRGL